ncbi:hypothetical protein DFH29DRAFT_878499 [Suillus ampliporus]|nr:hypothetical protein DFH29DRAFT_878499 [Suillus ampliporus]
MSRLCSHNHCQISPLYGPECEMVPAISLGFSNGSGDTGFHTVYERQLGDSDFLRVVVTEFCRPDALGRPGQLNALDHTIQFHEAPFPYGFPPPAPLATIEVAPISHTLQLFAPAMTDQELASLMPSVMPSLVGDIDYDYSCYTEDSLMQFETTHIEDSVPINTFPPIVNLTIVFHQDLIWRGDDIPMDNVYRKAINRALKKSHWKRLLYVTKAIYLGSYWVGLQNAFDFLEKLPEALENDKRLLSNCLVMAVEMNHTTLQEVHEHPQTQTGVQAVRWNVLCLMYCEQFAKYIESRNIEMHKVIRGCILSDTGFSGTKKDDQDAKVAHFFWLLSSDDRNKHSSGLAKSSSQGRIADLFPKEIQGWDGLLGSGLVATLLTVIYHALHIWLPDKTPGRKLSAMNRIITASLGKLYANKYQFPQFHEVMRKLPFITGANVLPIDPKVLELKMSANDNQPRNMRDILPIVMYTMDSTRPGLPNAVFTSVHSQRAMQEVDVACFQGGP